MSRGNRIMMLRGIQVEAWVMSYDLGGPERLGDLMESGFTPTFHEGPFWDADIMADPRRTTWGMAKEGMLPPRAKEKVLTEQQSAHVKNLTSLCLEKACMLHGEHESLAETLDMFKQWAIIAQAQLPHTIVHINHKPGVGSPVPAAQYRRLVRLMGLDMITIDNDDFPNGEPRAFSSSALATTIGHVRETAVEGADGLPVPFGFYMQPFEWPEGYVPSAAQVRSWYFLPLTMGAKWLCLYRWATGVMVKGGRRTAAWHTAQRANEQVRGLSPLLKMLQTSRVDWVAGYHPDPDGVDGKRKNPCPPYLVKFQPGGDAMLGLDWVQNWDTVGLAILGITVHNPGKANGGLPEDIFIGHFKPLRHDGRAHADPEEESMWPDELPSGGYFAVFNGLVPAGSQPCTGASPKTGPWCPVASPEEGTMELVMTLMKRYGSGHLELFEYVDGREEPKELREIGEGPDGHYEIGLTIAGGAARFFVARGTQHKKDTLHDHANIHVGGTAPGVHY